jgi:hypothetical protein
MLSVSPKLDEPETKRATSDAATLLGDCRLRFQSTPVSERLPLDEPRGFGLTGVGVLAFLEGMNGPADSANAAWCWRGTEAASTCAPPLRNMARTVSPPNRCCTAAEKSSAPIVLSEVMPCHSATWDDRTAGAASPPTGQQRPGADTQHVHHLRKWQ